jgi:outer membrane cobalamin receptor
VGPAESLGAVLDVLKAHGLEADAIVVTADGCTVQLRRTLPAATVPVAPDIMQTQASDRAEFERVLFASSRSPG